jgi:hypothetical protein
VTRLSTFLFSLLLVFLATTLDGRAAVSWDEVALKVRSSRAYDVRYSYVGDQGQYVMDYRYNGDGPKVRTEILSSKTNRTHVGTVILYDVDWNAEKIRVKTGGGIIVRNLTHKDIVERPHFHRGIFHIILERVGTAVPKVQDVGRDTLFTFPTGASIRANAKAEIVEVRHHEKGTDSVKKFSSHRWNDSPGLGF